MSYTVSRVSALANVSIRTLHHYDEIGLVRPSMRSEGGYRLYSLADLQRLQQVLFFRELDFPLDEIKQMLDEPGFDRKNALKQQAAQLEARLHRITVVLNAVKETISNLEGNQEMSAESMFKGFDQTQYEEETEQRWGNTDAYRISKTRTASYTPQQWEQLKSESDAIYVRLALAMNAGVKADSDAAVALAEEHRLSIDKWFYPCSHEMHRGLGDMYVADPRFTKNIDRYGAGVSAFLREAIFANAARHGC